MKKGIIICSMCLAMSLALSACAGDSNKGETTASAAETVDASETAGTETEAQSSLSVEEGHDEKDETDTSTAETEEEQVYGYDYDVEKLVTLGEYKGLTYSKQDITVSDEEVQSRIDQLLESYTEPEQITDRAAEKGDSVNIDFTGMFDGVPFDGGAATGYSLQLGSGNFIDGFEDGLVGVKPGEKVTLDLKFPDNYSNNPEYAGKDCTFDVTLNYIEGEEIIPEFDDEFVTSLGITDVKTVDQYRDYTEDQIRKSKEDEAETNLREELFTKVVDNSSVSEIPEELMAQSVKVYNEYYNNIAVYYGMEWADFLDQYLGRTEEEFNKDAEDYGKTVAKNVLVMCAIAKAEGFEVTDDIYNEKLAEYAEAAGYGDLAMFEEEQGKGNIKQYIINEKVIEVLKDNAVEVPAQETGADGAETAETETAAETEAE